jgi:tRNA1(Val) A37 N6-methylase TrmN6
MEMILTEDALLGGRARVLQPSHGYRVAVDAVLLAAAVAVRAGERVLDLGAGVGAVGLCLAARVPGCFVVGVELQPEYVMLAGRNAALNDLADRMSTIAHDLALPLPNDLGAFDHVVTNPPYLPKAVADPPPDPAKALATIESSADLAHWLAAAAGALKPAGGILTIIHRGDRLEEIVGHLIRLGLGALDTKQLLPANRVLVRARRSPVVQRREAPPLVLHRPQGGYTDEAEAVLRHGAALAF